MTWMGYWNTTGLATIDYAIMDRETVPDGHEKYFTEKLIYLPEGRFCYAPPGYAPDVALLPALHKGYVTFGSFNNIAKLTPEVITLWSRVLHEVPGSRLVLKWKSLADTRERERLFAAFKGHGIDKERLELRGSTPHPEMLREYGDIDIALDPFPFSGGLTSCEALWMGVPVITLPGIRPVSRQTSSLSQSAQLDGLIATDENEYIAIAKRYAGNLESLATLRKSLRQQTGDSPLCNGRRFTQNLETEYKNSWKIKCGISTSNNDPQKSQESESAMQKVFLHVGCGLDRKEDTTPEFNTPEWKELRFDINPAVQPDIIGTMLDMTAVADESVDAVLSSHNLEHLYPHEVPQVLSEFLRVLKPDGYLVALCPDLQFFCALIAEDKLTEPAYVSAAGPIAPLDVLYGLRQQLSAGNHYMAHKCGFTLKVLHGTLQAHGFQMIAGRRRPDPYFDLCVVASKGPMTDDQIRELAMRHFPA